MFFTELKSIFFGIKYKLIQESKKNKIFFFIPGRCFAELQLDGINCEVSKRPYELSVSFVLSSLMLIDALQTYGSEYELLLSSKQPNSSPGIIANLSSIS